MNYSDMFGMLGSRPDPYGQQNTPQESYPPYEPTFQETPRPLNWEEAFKGFSTRPVLYNMDGFISPYASNNWGGTSNILQYIDDQSRLPAVEQKIDPNKIFSAEVNGLRAIEADQQKIVKLFERKLTESLTEKGKIGLTEEDIEAMAALTSARSAITAIEKEKVAIKKNIAEIRIKQSQNNNPGGNAGPSERGLSSMDIGRSMLDDIFSVPSTSPTIPSTVVEYNSSDPSMAAQVIDSIVPNVGSHIQHESAEPTTYVVVGETDDDIEFATYSSSGDLMPDFPKPDTTITTIDRDAGKAIDSLLVEYPIKQK